MRTGLGSEEGREKGKVVEGKGCGAKSFNKVPEVCGEKKCSGRGISKAGRRALVSTKERCCGPCRPEPQ